MCHHLVDTGLMNINFFFSSRRRHTRLTCDWSSDVCSSDLLGVPAREIAFIHDANTDAQKQELFAKVRAGQRSEERRVGKECRSRWSTLRSNISFNRCAASTSG